MSEQQPINKAESKPAHRTCPKQILKLLKLQNRNMPEAEKLYDHFKTQTTFVKFFEDNFQDQDDLALIKLFQIIQYEFISQSDFVFHQGDPSNEKFYIIYSGKVGIYESQQSAFEQENWQAVCEDEKEEEEENNSVTPRNLAQRNSNFRQTFKRNYKKKLLTQKGTQIFDLANRKLAKAKLEAGFLKVELTEGQSFGQIALFQEKGSRTASVLCLEDSEFLIIYRKYFLTVLEKYNRGSMLKIEFLQQNIPLLSTVTSQKILETIVHACEERHYKKDDVLTLQDQQGDNLYFI